MEEGYKNIFVGSTFIMFHAGIRTTKLILKGCEYLHCETDCNISRYLVRSQEKESYMAVMLRKALFIIGMRTELKN
jgi:hypothetical protein